MEIFLDETQSLMGTALAIIGVILCILGILSLLFPYKTRRNNDHG